MEKTYKTVVLIGFDGAGEYIKDADIPNIRRIFGDRIKYGVKSVLPTISAECWGSMFTGKNPCEHGFTNHIIKRVRHDPHSDCPTFFRILREHDKSINLVSACNWDPINYGIIEEGLGVLKSTGENDEIICDDFCRLKLELDTGFFYVQLDETDDAGHDFGFGSSEYYDAIHKDDGYIGKMYDAVLNSGSYKDTLFILTADHGGIRNEHGGDSDREKYVFFASLDSEGISYNDRIDSIKDIFKFVLERFGY